MGHRRIALGAAREGRHGVPARPEHTAVRRPDLTRTGRVLLLAAVFVVLPGTTAAMLADRFDGEATTTTSSDERPGRTPPRPLGKGEAYVRTVVLPSGDLRVTHWIESEVPLLSVELAVPGADDVGTVEARNVRVVADGRRVAGSRDVTDVPEGYPLLGAGSVQVRYRLKDMVERDRSTPGRGLVLVTALDVRQEPAPERVTRSVLAPEVLSLACTPTTTPEPPEPPAPCGEVDHAGGRSVERAGERVGDRVLAQVSLR